MNKFKNLVIRALWLILRRVVILGQEEHVVRWRQDAIDAGYALRSELPLA